MATNVKVKVRKDEDINKAIRRFKKKYESEGVSKDIKKNRYYMKPSEAKKYKKIMKEARRRK